MNTKTKILVLGATGMAGHVIFYYLQNTAKYEMINIVFRNKLTKNSIVVDVKDCEKLEEIIKIEKPDIIINCIGVLINGSKEYPDNAVYINAYFPHFLNKLTDKIDSKLIHISTDCVFSGTKGNYKEDDFKDANDVYGRSKGLGEIINNKDITIRTSIIGPELKEHGEGLFHWFMSQKGEINGFVNSNWTGVTTLELAKVIEYAIENNSHGLIQISNDIIISKYNLLNLFNEIWNKGLKINPYEGEFVNKSLIKSKAFDYEVPSYKSMLLQQFNWMKYHKELYTQYYK